MLDQNDLMAILDFLERSQHEMKILLENETNKKINLMYESHQSIIKKLDQVEQLDP